MLGVVRIVSVDGAEAPRFSATGSGLNEAVRPGTLLGTVAVRTTLP